MDEPVDKDVSVGENNDDVLNKNMSVGVVMSGKGNDPLQVSTGSGSTPVENSLDNHMSITEVQRAQSFPPMVECQMLEALGVLIGYMQTRLVVWGFFSSKDVKKVVRQIRT